MKKLHKIMAIICCIALVLAVTACSGGAPSSAAPSQEDITAQEENITDEPQGADEEYIVGILQLVQHEALDAATKGFQDVLTEKLGDKVKFDLQNAQGDPNTCSTIANGFASSNVDLILANATASLQSSAAATATIPILGTSITEYGVALDIKDFTGKVGGNVSGTSDLPPLDQQAEIIKEIFPDAKTVGLVYCSAEPNSLYQVETVKGFLETMGYECTLYPFSDSNDLAAVTTSAVASSEVLYVPTDNTVASNTGIIDNICRPAGIPVIAGEQGICTVAGLATLSIDYYDLGCKTGQMAYEILTGQKDISDMEIQYAPNFVKKYNPEIAEALNITIPADYTAIEK